MQISVICRKPGGRKHEMHRQLRDIDSGNGHRSNGAIHICRKLDDCPVIFRIAHPMIYDDGVPMRYDCPLQEKPQSLQSAFVLLTFGLTDGKRNRIAKRRIHDRVIGIYHVHVREHVALID